MGPSDLGQWFFPLQTTFPVSFIWRVSVCISTRVPGYQLLFLCSLWRYWIVGDPHPLHFIAMAQLHPPVTPLRYLPVAHRDRIVRPCVLQPAYYLRGHLLGTHDRHTPSVLRPVVFSQTRNQSRGRHRPRPAERFRCLVPPGSHDDERALWTSAGWSFHQRP